MLLNPCFLKIESERDLGQRCFVAAEPSMQTRARSFHCKTGCRAAGRTVITITLHQCHAKGAALRPCPAEGLLFLPRVSNFSTLETGLVI